jgi:glutamine---fructose-6-phosphate transaminase (isomerizing)
MTDITHMRQEIDEIPAAVARLLAAGRPDLRRAGKALRKAQPRFLVTVARGSSDHAATYLKYAAELLIGIPVASIGPSIASVYAANMAAQGGACIAISQSGKSPDILALMRMLGTTAAPSIALCNTANAPLMHLADHAIDVLAGPEHSVAATKSFVSSIVAGLVILAEWTQDAALIAAIDRLPEHLATAAAADWPTLRASLSTRGPALVLGRGPGVALACEAALKLKETCAIHAEAYSCAEVLHGPVEMVSPRFTTLCLTATDAAEQGIADTADQLARIGAASFATSSRVTSATALLRGQTDHPLTDPLPLIVTFYATIERLSRDLGRNPDKPVALRKITETV